MPTSTYRRRNDSPIFRIIVLLLPAVYCSWRAFWFTLQTNWPSINLESDHRDHSSFEYFHHYLRLRPEVPLRPSPIVASNKAKDHSLQFFHDDKSNQTRNTLHNETECFGVNSRRWLDGPRLGNSEVSDGDNDSMLMPTRMTATTTGSILGQQAFCGPQSPFQSVSIDTTNIDYADNQQQQQRLWTTRLLFLAVHWHQHSPAILETQHRHANPNCRQALANNRVGSFDYECPTAKFLVVAFSKNGIGANLRLVAVPALMVGLVTQRVVLFVNDAPVGPDFLRQPWTLASCSRRRDAQCFFLPSSPCVVTEQDLAQAYQLQRGERRRLFRHGTLPEEHAHDRVLLMHLGSLRPQREPENLRHVLFQLSQTVLERILVHEPAIDTSTEELLRQAAHDILWVQNDSSSTTTETVNATFSYYGVNSPIFQSLLLYAMRPNPWAVHEMDAILSEMFPPNFDPHNTIGLPIRGKLKAVATHLFLAFLQIGSNRSCAGQPRTNVASKASVCRSRNTWPLHSPFGNRRGADSANQMVMR